MKDQYILKNSKWFIFIILLFTVNVIVSCNEKAKKRLPPPPTPIKIEIRFKDKKYIFKTEKEVEKFLDSVGIKDTLIRRKID